MTDDTAMTQDDDWQLTKNINLKVKFSICTPWRHIREWSYSAAYS